MPYDPMTGQWMPNQGSMTPQPANNNLWVGNNYSGYSPNRSVVNPQAAYPMQNNPQTINNVISVMGQESANEFRVGPNSKVILMDTNQPIFYLKCSDDAGFAKTRRFRYFEETDDVQLPAEKAQPTMNYPEPSLYLTKEEFNDFKREVENFKNMIEELVTKNG